MKPYKNICCLILVPVLLSLFTACADERFDNGSDGASSVTINLSLEKVEEATSALKYATGDNSPRLDFNTINDLNVIVYSSTSTTPTVYYYSASTPHPASLSFPITSGSASFSIYNTTAVAGVYLVANYGSAISSASVLTPSAIQALTVTLPANNLPDKCVMYAQAQNLGTGTPGNINMGAQLKRSLAMVTVSLHGKNLYNGVSIKPTSMSITNVPLTTTIGGTGNKVIAPLGLRTGYSLVNSNWPALVNNTADSIVGYNTHQTTNTMAFFTYENMQGNAAGVSNQINKKSDINLKPYATYVTVKCQYAYGAYKGDITYRFCLGTNAVDNYDVMRNTHYTLKLYLSGWGGAQEGGRVSNNTLITGTGQGVNWRVVMNLYDFGFSETDYNFDAHLSQGFLPVRGSCKFATYRYNPSLADSTQMSQHWILTTKANNTWDIMVPGRADVIKNDQFTYFIKPWRYTDPGFPKTPTDRQYRECFITIENTNGGNVQTVVFRQWAPIKITNTLYLERFDEGKTSGASNLAWGYNGTSVLPSGFVYWTAGGADNNYGFENTIKLSINSPAAGYTMRKGGYDLRYITPIITSALFKQAAYHMPTAADMDTVSLFVFDPFDPLQTNLDPLNVSVDYWSSSANNSSGTYFWNSTTKAKAITTNRTLIKKVRAVYRPSKDTP